MACTRHRRRTTPMRTASADSMLNTPRTPQECRSANLWITSKRRGALRQKVGRQRAENPWIISCAYPKCLIVETLFCRIRLGIPPICRFLPPIWCFLPRLDFRAFPFLSLFKYKKRKKKEGYGIGGRVNIRFHVYSRLYKKASTDFHHPKPLIRGNPWTKTAMKSMAEVACGVLPRIHGLRCATPTGACQEA